MFRLGEYQSALDGHRRRLVCCEDITWVDDKINPSRSMP